VDHFAEAAGACVLAEDADQSHCQQNSHCVQRGRQLHVGKRVASKGQGAPASQQGRPDDCIKDRGGHQVHQVHVPLGQHDPEHLHVSAQPNKSIDRGSSLSSGEF
jgi:hypothetical protein